MVGLLGYSRKPGQSLLVQNTYNLLVQVNSSVAAAFLVWCAAAAGWGEPAGHGRARAETNIARPPSRLAHTACPLTDRT